MILKKKKLNKMKHITIQKTKRLYQAVLEGVGTIYQDHNLDNVMQYLKTTSLLTGYTGFDTATDKALKYGELLKL